MTDDDTFTLGGRMTFPPYGDLHATMGIRLPPICVSVAIIAPNERPRGTVRVNLFQHSYGHMHETFLCDTANNWG